MPSHRRYYADETIISALKRDVDTIWKGTIASLKRGKEDVREVQKGMECGILLNNFTDFKENDILEPYEVTYIAQEL